MKQTVGIGAVTINQTPLDWSGNRERIVQALNEARSAGAKLVCLPELCISGYGCEDMFLAHHVRERSIEELIKLQPETKGLAVTVGLVLDIRGAIYNAMAMLVDGKIAGMVCKQHLAGDGIHYEPRWFNPWPAGKVVEVEIAGQSIPVGDLVFDFQGLGIGMEICRDAWVKDRPARRMANRGVSLLLNPSGSHFAFGKQDNIRKRLVMEGSQLINGCCVYTNLHGNESGRSIYEGGALFANRGELVAEGPRFSFADHTLTLLNFELEQRCTPSNAGHVVTHFDLSSEVHTSIESTLVKESSKHEDFAQAVSLGLFDYLRKSHSHGFVLSLSGGADSGAVATLVWLMQQYGTQELGQEEFRRKLPQIEKLLTTVYQATENSSEVTRMAAQDIAAAVDAEHHEWQIDSLVEGYTQLAADSIGRKLNWEQDDIALQNIQARVRAPGIWMMANLRGALLLTTGNRSEASVGYCTMDGDTAGGLAPIAGIDKAYLRHWLCWMETTGPAGIGPLTALGSINNQQPTAELRPQASGQTDEADLMPYPVLDAIERAVIADRQSPEEVLGWLTNRFPQYQSAELQQWLDRFMRLWRISQWKRERLAPSFHLDQHNVDPKTWHRYPILSGE